MADALHHMTINPARNVRKILPKMVLKMVQNGTKWPKSRTTVVRNLEMEMCANQQVMKSKNYIRL